MPPTLSEVEYTIIDLLSSEGEMYGLQIVAASDIPQGTIYVTLGRMVDKGYLDWRLSRPRGRPVRMYEVSEQGTRVLRAWEAARAVWNEAR